MRYLIVNADDLGVGRPAPQPRVFLAQGPDQGRHGGPAGLAQGDGHHRLQDGVLLNLEHGQ